MLPWKERRTRQEQIAKLGSLDSTPIGANRRAINLVPLPEYQEKREITQSHHLRYQQLLVSIEAKQSTCCLRIISQSNLSRAAILVFRGRVIGCVYGRKDLGGAVFGEEAHRLATAELANPGNILDTYLLSDELALAGAALFHGASLEFPQDSAENSFEWAVMQLTRSNAPGCIVINNSENVAVCMVYIFGGHIVGVYSFKRGWLEPSYQAAVKILLGTKGSSVMASGLFAHNLQELTELTFSLTGLADREVVNVPRRANSARSTFLNSESNWLASTRSTMARDLNSAGAPGVASPGTFMRSSLRRSG